MSDPINDKTILTPPRTEYPVCPDCGRRHPPKPKLAAPAFKPQQTPLRQLAPPPARDNGIALALVHLGLIALGVLLGYLACSVGVFNP